MTKAFKRIKFTPTFILATLLSSLIATSCISEITPKREVRERDSFGTELYNIVLDNTVQSPTYGHDEQFISTFLSYKSQFIDAVDSSAVPEDLEAVNQVFVNIVPLYKNMLYPTMLRKIGTVIGEIKEDPAAVNAMAWMLGSPNLQCRPQEGNPLGLVMNYPELPEITDELLDLILKKSSGDRNSADLMLRELSVVTSDLETDTDPNRFIWRAADMLLKPDPIYAPQGGHVPQIAAALDPFGHAKIAFTGALPVPLPFIDANYDGYADRDALGYYINQTGFRISPFETESLYGFSSNGNHELIYNDQQVFSLIDLQETPLAYLIRESNSLLKDNTLDEALRASSVLLGDPQTYVDEHGSYTGYDKYSGVAQLLSAILTTLNHDSVGPNFEAVIQLLDKNENVVARLLRDIDIIIDIYDQTPNNISLDNNLVDRLLPELLKIAEDPGLLDELLIALDDPRAAYIAPILSELADLKKEFIKVEPGGAYDSCFQTCDKRFNVGTIERMRCIRSCPIDEVIGHTRAEHNKPESLENRSLFQRILHLMWETSGTHYAVRTERLIVSGIDLTNEVDSMLGDLLVFDNLAESYLMTITGDLHLSEHISPTFIELAGYINANATNVASLLTFLTENMFDLKLSVDPTTAEVTRMFNMSTILSKTQVFEFYLTPANCRSGFRCLQAHADTLYAVEASGLVDAMYPILYVFNKRHKTAILANICSIILEYYTTGAVQYVDITGEPLDLHPSDFRSIEPMLIRALDETNIVSDVGALCDALLNVELSDGTKLTQRFEKFVKYLLTPDPGLKNIRNENFIIDPLGNRVSPISPAYLYVEGIRALSKRMDAFPGTGDQLIHAIDGIEKVTVRTIRHEDGSVIFEKPAGIRIISNVLELLHSLWLEKSVAGTRDTWIQDTAIPKVVDLLSGRLVYAFFQMFNDLDKDPDGLEKFRKFVLHVLEPENPAPRHLVGIAYQLISWILDQDHLYALLKAVSPSLDPDREWHTGYYDDESMVSTILSTVHSFNQADPEHVFNRVFYRMFESDTRERPNILRLLDVGWALFRTDVGSTTPLSAQDHKKFLDFAYDFLMDDDRGVERIYSIIDFTVWGTAGRPANYPYREQGEN